MVNMKNKGQNIISFVFEALLTIFIIIIITYALGPILTELAPGYSLLFFFVIVAMIISIIIGIISRLSR